jgi:phage terminase large subunit-like protein
VLEDLTCKAGPGVWGRVACDAYERWDADRIVAEVNYGGAMVHHVIKTCRPNTPFRPVKASRGKVVRAEPISALVENGKVRMAGVFQELEDELCAFTTHGYMGENSPNRADACIWALADLFPQLTKPQEPTPEPKQQFIRRSGGTGWMRV